MLAGTPVAVNQQRDRIRDSSPFLSLHGSELQLFQCDLYQAAKLGAAFLSEVLAGTPDIEPSVGLEPTTPILPR